MRKFIPLLAGAVALLGMTMAGRADWNPGEPFKMHWPQLPDLTTTGLDVLATIQPPPTNLPQWKILADDWRCSESGPVDDIHIWGSWLSDMLPIGNLPGGQIGPNAGNVKIKLSIHSDVPKDSGAQPLPFSHPGEQLWSYVFSPGQFIVRPYATGTEEHFFDPNPNALYPGGILGHDNTIWQYNFTHIGGLIPPFVQTQNTIYWLDVQVMPLDPMGNPDPTKSFGWKTTNPLETPHFMDDAVFADTEMFAGPLVNNMWTPLVYPIGHPFQGQSIDLAFVITPEPASLGLLVVGTLGLLLRRRRS
jgi:hypothetical protein